MPDTPLSPPGSGRYPADMESRVAVLEQIAAVTTSAALERIERRLRSDRPPVRSPSIDVSIHSARNIGPISAGCSASCWVGFGAHAGRHGARVPLAVDGLHRPAARNLLAHPVMDWDAPAIVLDARPYGEGDAIATVMTAEHGAHRGLARGGAARGRTAIWQPGNLVQVRWVARLAEQLGSFSAELVHPGGRTCHGRSRWRWRCCRRPARWRKARCRNASRIRACSTACCI